MGCVYNLVTDHTELYAYSLQKLMLKEIKPVNDEGGDKNTVALLISFICKLVLVTYVNMDTITRNGFHNFKSVYI